MRDIEIKFVLFLAITVAVYLFALFVIIKWPKA